MSPFSRRQVLGAVTALAAGGSGCAGAGGRGEPASETPTVTEEERTFSHCESDPDTRQVYHPEGEPAIRSSAYTPPGDWGGAEWVITAPSERDALEFSAGAVDVEAARAFVDDTDLSAQTLLVNQHTFWECTPLRVERVKWKRADHPSEEAFEVAIEYAHTDEDVDCGTPDSKFTMATILQIPAEIETVARLTWATHSIGEDDC